MTIKKGLLVAMTLLVCLGLTENAYSMLTEMEIELKLIYTSQNQKGGVKDADSSKNADYFPNDEVFATGKALEAYKSGYYQSGSQEMKDPKIDRTLYLIYKIETEFRAGKDIAADLKTLLSYRRSDGGWGHLKRASTNFHTACALRVLGRIKYMDQKVFDAALDYLKSRQNKDGGWGLKKGDNSSLIITTTVLKSFAPFQDIFVHQMSINKGTAYLFSQQNPDGSFSEKKRQ